MGKILKLLILLILLGFSVQLRAYEYDPLLMRAQASIFPKIILLDKDLDSKVENEQVLIEILHSIKEKSVALKIKQLIEQQYKNNLGNKKLAVKLNEFEKFDSKNVATAYFILKGENKIHNKVTAHAAGRQRLVFSYDYKDFESNSLVSVLMKEKTYIYLNKSAIHDYDIKFLPLFYKIVKVIE